MPLQAKRIARHIAPAGFSLLREDRITFDIIFVRASRIGSLFEFVTIAQSSPRRADVGAAVEISLLRDISRTRILGNRFFLKELVINKRAPESGWTPISTNDDAVEWERNLARVAPQRASELAEAQGVELLAKTATLRGAVTRYLACIPNRQSLAIGIDKLQQQATSELLKEADRLFEGDCVLRIRGDEQRSKDIYRLASLLVAVHGQEVDAGVFLGKIPLLDEGLMGRLQLIADTLDREVAAGQRPGPGHE
jgi:hypothetical protein